MANGATVSTRSGLLFSSGGDTSRSALEAVDSYLETFDLDGIVLTGGNDISNLDDPTNTAPVRDRFEREALGWSLANDLPVLGVCRSLAFVNDYVCGSLTNVSDLELYRSLVADGELSRFVGL